MPARTKIVLIGRGTPTPRQLELLSKALGVQPSQIEVAETIEQLNSPKQITETLKKTGATTVFSLVLHPAVIANLATARRFANFDYYAPETEAVKIVEVASREEAEKLAKEFNADIVNVKALPNGKLSARLLHTKRLLKNPVVRIEAEEYIE